MDKEEFIFELEGYKNQGFRFSVKLGSLFLINKCSKDYFILDDDEIQVLENAIKKFREVNERGTD